MRVLQSVGGRIHRTRKMGETRMTWEDVPGFFDFQAVYDMAVDTAEDVDTLVEVGTLFGKSAVYMAAKIKASGKNLSFYVVDKWEPRGWPGVVRAVDESFGQVEHVGISWVVRG